MYANRCYCRLQNGRRSAADFNIDRQLLTPAEEQILVETCESLQDLGFPPAVYQIKEFAKELLARRGGKGKFTKFWWRNFRRRHPEVCTKWSQQMDFVRVFQGNYLLAITKYFQMLQDTITKFNIKSENTYNVDDVGFVMGLAESAKVVVVHPHQ